MSVQAIPQLLVWTRYVAFHWGSQRVHRVTFGALICVRNRHGLDGAVEYPSSRLGGAKTFLRFGFWSTFWGRVGQSRTTPAF